jgi:hypothetical protein
VPLKDLFDRLGDGIKAGEKKSPADDAKTADKGTEKPTADDTKSKP